MHPLVSAVTPTYNRREFFPRAIRCFLSQDYPNIEWIIADNGTDQIRDLLPEDPRIKHFPLLGTKLNHGQLMNICCERAAGTFCIVEDDDDFYTSSRVSRQIQPMLNSPQITITGTSQLYYALQGTQRAFHYVNKTNLAWIGAIAFRKSAWEAHRFNDKPHGADYDFLTQVPRDRWCDLADTSLLVAASHSTNAARKSMPSSSFVEVPWAAVQAIAKGEL
jgi:glycosyltransferase involved in cell wall biosynthesis